MNLSHKNNHVDLKPKHRLMVRWLIYKKELLTTWEKKFLESLSRFGWLSFKQENKLLEIYQEVRFSKNREYRSPIREEFRPEEMASLYAYVHWRD